MKKKNILEYILYIVSVSISVVLAITTTDVFEKFSFDWLKFTLIVSSIVVVVSFVMTTALMTKHWKIKTVYISYTPNGKDIADRITKSIENEDIQSSTTLTPGLKMNYNISKAIHNSNICFVIIGDHISAMQKEEIKIISSQKKKVITIVTPGSGQIPPRLRDIVPLQSNDTNFDDKVIQVVSQLK